MNNDNLEKFLDNAYRDIILGNYRSPKTDAKKVRAMVAGEINGIADKPVEKYTLSTGSMAVFGKPSSSTNVVSTAYKNKVGRPKKVHK